MSITFTEAVSNNLISERVTKLIPNKCRCGASLEFSDSLRILRCSNKKCEYNIVNRIKNMLEYLNIEYNDYNILKLVKKLGIVTPYQILMLDEVCDDSSVDLSSIHDISKLTAKIKDIKNSKYYLYQIVEMCGIKTISCIALKIFDGFKSFDRVFEEIEQGQVTFINERLGIKSSESSMISVFIYNKLLELRDELIFGETQLQVKEYSKEILNIAFCDNNIPFLNRSETLNYLESISNYKFNIVTTIDNNTDILIRNSDGNNSKNRVARIINDEYIANAMNNNEISIGDINRKVRGKLKPVGNKIYIDTLEGVIHRLKELHESGD